MKLSPHDQVKAKNYIQDEIEGTLIGVEGRLISSMPHVTSEDIRVLRIDMSPATPETKWRVRKRPDPLMTLRRKGIIEDNDLAAAQYILIAVTIICKDGAVKTAKFETSTGGIGDQQAESAWEIRVQKQYADWYDACEKKRIVTGMILDILTMDMTLKEVDRKWHKDNGVTRDMIIAGLRVYVKMFRPILK
jgi:hypothetical protein